LNRFTAFSPHALSLAKTIDQPCRLGTAVPPVVQFADGLIQREPTDMRLRHQPGWASSLRRRSSRGLLSFWMHHRARLGYGDASY
jgi:hypothetical protein